MKSGPAHLGLPVFALLATGGCLAQRGVDFGHWMGTAELTPLVRVVETSTARAPAMTAHVILLPPVGDLPAASAEALQRELFKEARNYFPVTLSSLPPDAAPARYVEKDNLLPDGTQLDIREAARMGAVLGATHVLGVHVRDYRPYPPQVLALRLVLVEVATARTVIEVDASFDASQQQVSIALADYLQRRSAREFGRQSLGVIIRSPAEYSAFVSACCCRSLARALWGVNLTKGTAPDDDTETKLGTS